MSDWQLIDSAPKDGSSILVSDGSSMAVAKWDEVSMGGREGWQVSFINTDGMWTEFEEFDNPTHWMSLPGLPK